MSNNNFTTGNKIKAFDFEPMTGREDRYIIGTVTKVDEEYGFYVTQVEEDTLFPHNKRETVYVPIEMLFDFEGRVTLAE